ncbi:MAG: VanW family protein, partial [Clostridium sp.]
VQKTKSPLFKYWIPAIILIVIILSVTIFIGVKDNTLIKSYSSKSYPESYVLGTDVSGLTKEELRDALTKIIGEVGTTKIKVNVGKKVFETTYKNIDVTIPFDDLENTILDFGKDKSFFTKASLIKSPEKKNYDFLFSYNEEKYNDFLDSISKDVTVAPVNSTINIDGGSIVTTDSQVGYNLNYDELKTSLNSSMKDITPKSEINLTSNLIVVNETVKKDALLGVTSKVSTFTTSYPAGPSGYNLQIAAGNIDNSLLMPGESFSCEKGIGPTTPENGFVLANTYVNGKVVKNYGGGVCQVSSTLYNTMLRAGIIPFERQNHMMTVAYVPIGLDATLADNAIDLKFKNETDSPIVINTVSGNGSLTIEFWSNPSILKGLSYEPKSVANSPLSADTYLYSYDSNGSMISEKFLDTSTYQPFNN